MPLKAIPRANMVKIYLFGLKSISNTGRPEYKKNKNEN
jgi:hypothetical protein